MILKVVELSIITVNYRSRDLLQRLLDSTATLDNFPAAEWIIVDHSPQPERLAESLRFPSHLLRSEIIENPANTGFGGGCNLGASQASGEVLLFLNPDCCFTGGSFIALMDRLENTRDLAALGPDRARDFQDNFGRSG